MMNLESNSQVEMSSAGANEALEGVCNSNLSAYFWPIQLLVWVG